MSAPSSSKSKQRASSGEDPMVEIEELTTPTPEIMQIPLCGRQLRPRAAVTPGKSTGTSGSLKHPHSSPQVSPSLARLTPSLSSPSDHQCPTWSPLSSIEELGNSGAINGK